MGTWRPTRYVGGSLSSEFSRRAVLGAGLASAALLLAEGCGTDSATFQGTASNPGVPAPAPVPPAPVAPRVVKVTLDVQMSTTTVDGLPFIARSFRSNSMTGPNIRVKPGDNLQIKLNNLLPPNPDNVPHDINIPHQFNSTNLHTHGLHVSPMGNSDNIFIDIAPGESFEYSYQIPSNHPAGTFFYHPHKHGSSSVQNFSGMSGLLIVEGGVDGVKEVAAAADVPFLINELMQNAQGRVPDYTARGSFTPAMRKFVVNGVTRPTFTIRPGEVQRWRVVHAGVSWNIPFAIEGHTLHTIAFDGITYPTRMDVTQELLSPGNRLDVLVRGGAPGTYRIMKLEHQQANAGFGNIAKTVAVHLATLVVAGAPMDMGLPFELPAPLRNIADSEITGRRTVVYNTDFGAGGPSPQFSDNFTVDNKRFAADRVDQLVQLGAVEEWTITNPMADTEHPFHIHINPFQVVSINGVAVPPRWQDTVILPFMGTVVIRTRFEDFTGLFVNHCHFLAHEDQGMMQTVSVV